MNRIIPILLILLFSTGCATQKSATRYITKHPDILSEFIDTTRRVEYKDTIIYKDKIIEIRVAGDTVYDDTIINIVGLLSGYVEAENQYARAEAWVKDSVLSIALYLKEQSINLKIDSAVIANIRTEIIYETKWLPSEPYIPKRFIFYKYGYFINQALVLIMIILLIRALKKF